MDLWLLVLLLARSLHCKPFFFPHDFFRVKRPNGTSYSTA